MRRACFVALAAGVWVACLSPSPAPASISPGAPGFAPSVADSVPGEPLDRPPIKFVQNVSICPSEGCFDPAKPICAGDSIFVLVEGVFPNGCYRQTGVDLYYPPFTSVRLGPPWVRILYTDRTCEGPCTTGLVPLRARIKLPPLPAGSYGLTVVQQPAGCDTVPLPLDPVAFTVKDSCDTLPPPPNTLPHVDQITICRLDYDASCDPVCATDSVLVRIRGTFPSDCYSLKRIDVLPSIETVVPLLPRLRIVVENGCCLRRLCTPGPYPWDAVVALPPPIAQGLAVLTVSLAELCCTDTVPPGPLPTAQYRVPIGACIPPPDTLPFVDQVRVCRDYPPDATVIACEPICPQDSIAVLIAGTFPNDCYRLKRVDILPPFPSFREAAPRLRVVVDNFCCAERLCLAQPTPWHTVVKLPPMSAGPYDLTVMVAEVCCSDTVPDMELPTAHYPFAVSSTCGEPPGEKCLWGDWIHSSRDLCDAYLSPGTEATVTFGINSTVRLAGLQGDFSLAWPVPASLDPPLPAPFISRIVPVGAAAGMHLTWTATRSGARFVLFADAGAPIPAAPPFTAAPVPVLGVTVEMPAGATPPNDIAVTAETLLGADAAGGSVPICAMRDNWRIAYPRARICTSVGCDFNGDGHADVCDLVTMVRCLRSDSCQSPARFDCDLDGGFDLDDVLCCAWKVLRRPPCPGCAPDTTPPRKEDGVKLVLDAPTIAGGDVQAGLGISGADRVGGARVELRFPSDRYEFVSLEGIGSEWLALTDVEGDAIVIGLIRIAEPGDGVAANGADVRGVLKLRLKAGMSPGGELATAASEFSGPDGARLEVESNPTSLPLAKGMGFALSDNRPDPFSGTTRFTLTLPVAADADLGVFDVGGRRVATLHRGRLTAGVTEFAWNGTSETGGRVASGVYFYRATVAGRTLAKKLVVLNE